MDVEITLSLGNNEIVTINIFHFPKANNKKPKRAERVQSEMGYLGTLGRGIMSPLPLYYSQKGWGLGTSHFLCKTVIKFPHSSSLFPQSVKDGCDGLTLVILYSV